MTQLYKLSQGSLTQVQSGRLAKEEALQDWIEKKPELLGLDLLIIGREVQTSYDGWIDLLGLDDEGNLLILELKRDRTPRDIIAQVLDYASWVSKLSTAEVREIAGRYLSKSLDLAFQERFKAPMPESLNDQHSMIIIASAFDASSQRIVRYLSEEHEIAINTAFFSVFENGSETFLVTNWLLDQTEVAERSDAKNKVQRSDLLALATNNKVSKFVEICQQLAADAQETTAPTYGGSFRYFFRGKMVFGVNVAGARGRPPIGELDVWLPVPTLEDLTGTPGSQIREVLRQNFDAIEAGKTDCIVRLKSPDIAQKLVSLLHEWLTASKISQSTTAK